MKKLLTLLLIMASVCTMSAQDNSGYTPSSNSMDEVVRMLTENQAFVFLNVGEERDLKDVFTRSGQIFTDIEVKELESYDWIVANESVAIVDKNDGVLEGKSYGETFLTVIDNNNTEHYFVVLVSPKVTVYTPEGVVLEYQKMYDQPARIQLTESKDYVVNCVMVRGLGSNEWRDITAEVAADELEDGDGYYESEETVVGNIEFTISHESKDAHKDNNSYIVGGSGVNLQVVGKTLTVVDVNGDITRGAGFTYSDVQGNQYSATLNDECKYEFTTAGVYFINFDNVKGTFKVFMH